MSDIIIADTSCLIILEKAGELSVLKILFQEIIITPDVKAEFQLQIPEWIKVKEVQDIQRQRILMLDLDIGEASAIALALETASSLLIIDERKGRNVAKELGLKTLGTLGCLLKAKEKGYYSQLAPVLQKLQNAGFYISEALAKEILKIAGEI
ncbi:MAG: DUF3368 domain-containing protein [Saprospirales bacterium]|nr:DUF3368 domain-containing protein [Saprospirales bacterium]